MGRLTPIVRALPILVLGTACSDPPVELFVDLRTDYVGGVEARLARVRVHRGDEETPVRMAETALVDDDLTDGERIAEVSALEKGVYRVVVSLEGNLRVPERSIRVSLDTTRAVTVVITRDCMEVACPAPESPTLTECLGGRCVDPTCTPEQPASCPTPECTADSECTTDVDCAVAVCVGGVCSARGDRTLCPGTEYCDPSFGCRPRPGLPPDDAGMDGGMDAAPDAGADAADAADSTVDAGPDAMDGSTSSILALSAGYAHTCAIIGGGQLWCWGDNRDGQLGDPSLGTGTTTPRRIGAATDWTDVVCAGHFDVPMSRPAGYTCGIRAGRLYCWGKNDSGELGLGDRTPVATPTRVGASNDWTTLSAEWAHTLGLQLDGSLWAWGEGGNGANGNGSAMDQLTPVRVGSATWREIAAGDDHGCGIQSDGSLWCWGNGTNGETALGMESIVFTPTRVGSATSWHGLTANCALRGRGDLYCWGNNVEGRVGDGTTMPALTPVPVGSSFIRVRTSLESTLAIFIDGSLWAWGLNDTAQLGDGSLGSRVLTPTPIGTDIGWQVIAPADFHGCGVRDGTVYCWGNTQDGRTGTDRGGILASPTPVAF